MVWFLNNRGAFESMLFVGGVLRRLVVVLRLVSWLACGLCGVAIRTLLLLSVLYLSTPSLLHTLCTPSSIPEVCCICSIIQFYRHTGVTGFRDLPGFQIRSLKIIVTATTYNTTTYNDFLSLASTDFVYRRVVLCLQFHHLVFI